jgi:hypothetical protein
MISSLPSTARAGTSVPWPEYSLTAHLFFWRIATSSRQMRRIPRAVTRLVQRPKLDPSQVYIIVGAVKIG